MDYNIAKKTYKKSAKRKPEGDSWLIYKRLITYAKPYSWILVIAFIANMAYSGIDSIFAYLLKPLINKGFVSPEPSFLQVVPLVIIGLFMLRGIVNLIGNYCMGLVARRVVLCFRQEIFKQLLHLPCSFYDTSSSGQLLSMILYNSSQVASACTDAFTNLVQSIFLAIGLLVVMLSISWHLTLVFFLSVPIIAILVKISGKRLRSLNWKAQETMGDIAHTAEEAIEGYKVVRIFGSESYVMDKFTEVAKANLFREMKIIVTKCLSVSGVQFIAICSLAGMIYIGTATIGHVGLTAGGFTAVMAAMMALLKPLKDLTTINSTIQRGLAGAESIFQLLDQPIENNLGKQKLQRVRGEIIFDNVSFNYPQNTQFSLNNISFKVPAGQVVALVGKSGSGKSTIANLLLRFYDYQSGIISLDGYRLSDIDLYALREQFAAVSQSVVLFNDTIANNIAYGKLGSSVTDEQVYAAAAAAHVLEFTEKLPQGLDTIVGENGVLLSGGQRQRIAIARAILKDAPVLILDEATSALDVESEHYIQAALEKIIRNRTTIVIAHRLSTIENADKVVVLDHGQIVEIGDHKSLLARQGHYSKMHRMHESQTTLTG